MSSTDLGRIEGELRSIKECLAQLAKQMGRRSQEPQVLTMDAAARALSRSTKTLRRLIVGGHVLTVTVGKRVMVPRSEIERLATPTVPTLRPRAPRAKRAPAPSRGGRFNLAAELAKRKR